MCGVVWRVRVRVRTDDKKIAVRVRDDRSASMCAGDGDARALCDVRGWIDASRKGGFHES